MIIDEDWCLIRKLTAIKAEFYFLFIKLWGTLVTFVMITRTLFDFKADQFYSYRTDTAARTDEKVG